MKKPSSPLLQKYRVRERYINAATAAGTVTLIGLIFAFGADEKDVQTLNTHQPAVVVDETAPSSHYEPSTFSSQEDPATLRVNQCTPELKKCADFTITLSNKAYYDHLSELQPGNTVIIADINGL